ncbi:MAG: endoflagellar motor protein [Spirochaetes bacterium]|nr:MAG: endoflagellar motor protein [Spirochaetota bacterium]
MRKKTPVILSILIALVFAGGEVKAQMFYTPAEYKKVYNEKVAVELELKSLKSQFANEKANYESRIKDLESKIESLNKQLANLEAQRANDRKLCDSRVKELQNTIDILQKKGSDKEKELVEENKKLQERYEKELAAARKELQDERDRNIKELDALKKSYEARISDLQREIQSLNNEISSLKKLTAAQKAELDRMDEQRNELAKQLESEISKGQIRLKKLHNKLIINIDDKISFDSGSAQLKKEILPALDKITRILAEYPENTIMVEGHTDNIPIFTAQFRDNWQLSTERALAVLGYLLLNKKLNAGRFGAAGFADFHPIVPNDTDVNRSLNRRVDLVVIPRVAE